MLWGNMHDCLSRTELRSRVHSRNGKMQWAGKQPCLWNKRHYSTWLTAEACLGPTWHCGIAQEERHRVLKWNDIFENWPSLQRGVRETGLCDCPPSCHTLSLRKTSEPTLSISLSLSVSRGFSVFPAFSYMQILVHREIWLRGSLFPLQTPGLLRMTFTLNV